MGRTWSALGNWGIVGAGIGLALGTATGMTRGVQAGPGSDLTEERREAMRFPGHGGWGQRHGEREAGGWPRFCGSDAATRVDKLVGFVEGYLALGPGQAEAWQRLVEALRRGQASLETTCEAPEPAAAGNPAVAELDRAEALLATGLDVVRALRPPLADLYASLTGPQRAALDALLARRGRP